MPAADGFFHVYTLPVGQGNAHVIQCPSGEVSIFDMGSCTSATAGFWIAQDIRDFLQGKFHLVTNIFLTHNDADHYNLLDEVFLSAADVTGLESIYISRQLDDWADNVRNWANNIGVTHKVETFNNGNTCGSSGGPSCGIVDLCPQDSGITTRVLSVNAGQQCSPREWNVDSIVLEITYDSFKLQLNGDFEDCTPTQDGPLQQMVDFYGSQLVVTVYMLSHHGAESKANKEVIRNAVAPKAVFVSSDPWFRNYHHPRCAIIDAFINDVQSLCRPGETSPWSRFYCGQHPITNLPLADKLQSFYSCGQDNYVWTEDDNDYAIYSTTPDKTHMNLVHLLTDGTLWGFVNNLSPLFNRQRTSGSRASAADECVDED